MAAPLVAVVIPYFQRQAGVLRRALASVAAQQDPGGTVLVLVVDDESPAPAGPEVAAVTWPTGMQVRVIQRANGGPGAARNTGMDAVDDGTPYIAFLDSDDEWSADHLARAVAVLKQGYDFYFADLLQLGADVTAFLRARRISPAEHLPLPAPPATHAYQGDFFDQTLSRNVVGTPTVVIACDRLGKLRFRTEFTSAGEDYLFWMEAARAGARVAFSTQCEVTCGRGVNVFAGAGWGTEGHLKRLHDELGFKKYIQRSFKLNPEQTESITQAIGNLRLGFAREVLRRLRSRSRFPDGLLQRHARLDVMSFALLPWHTLRIAALRGRKLASDE